MEQGTQVRLIQPTIEGTITDTEYDKGAKCLRHLVEWTDASGNTQSRWFIEAELEAI